MSINRYKSMKIICIALSLWVLVGCKESQTTFTADEASMNVRTLLALPDHFAPPFIPAFNPITAEKIALGRHLFYDERLSANETQSCSSCHDQSMAFADGVAAPIGSTGHQLVRNSQGLGNAVYHATFTWANDGFTQLEDQLQVPIRADNPIELGVTENYVAQVLARFDADPLYANMFAQAFPESESGATINKIIFALASFSRTLISGDSRYDQYLLGDRSALTAQEIEGFQLFNGEKFECFHCHTGMNFTVSYRDAFSDPSTVTLPFFNNGLYNLGGEGRYPAEDQGLYDLTLNPDHRGLFRPQSLRNVGVTAPYMHDGSIATLRGVIEHYASGGRTIESGPYAGDGSANPLKSGLVRGFDVSEEEMAAILAFLNALTDETFINNPAHSNPFEE